MALSESVQQSLNEVESSLRNALSYAARQERPVVCSQIANLLSDVESIGSFDNLLDKLDDTISELDN